MGSYEGSVGCFQKTIHITLTRQMSLVIVSQINNFGLQISSNYVCFSK